MNGILNGFEVVLIFVLVGVLIGIWIVGGIVLILIYYGLEFIYFSIFLFVMLIICLIMLVVIGMLWGIVGIVGIVMIVIGEGLGFLFFFVVGVILLGVYFGDKLFFLFDSIVLVFLLFKVDVLDYVRVMFFLFVLVYVIIVILFIIIGFMYGGKNIDFDKVEFLKLFL